MFSGLPYSKLVTFNEGFPDGVVSWSLTDVAGSVIATGTVTPPALAVSIVVTTSAANNTLAGGALKGIRHLVTSYTVNGISIGSRTQYEVLGVVPFGASYEGVRNKLGVPEHNLGNDEIKLVEGYYEFRELATAVLLDAVVAADNSLTLRIADAIEASAALELLPTMALRVAAQESSGTDQFKRMDVDWTLIESKLREKVEAGRLAVNTGVNPTDNFGSLFTLGTSEDRFTGA
jgi:hypothetical protein